MGNGWVADNTSISKDFGVDVLAYNKKYNIKLAIQTKYRSAKKISNKAVQEVVAGLNYYNCDYGCVISNARFTESAKILAKANLIDLVHHNQISLYLDDLILYSINF